MRRVSAWLYRWENGDTSIVWAETRLDAAELLDEVGMADPKYLIPIPTGAVHLTLADDGELAYEGMAEELTEVVDHKAYPILAELWESDFSHAGGAEDHSDIAVARAVAAERERVHYAPEEAKSPDGKVLAKQMNLSGPVADKWALESAKVKGVH